MSVLQWLDNIDKSLFTLIHADGAIPSLDGFFLWLRKGSNWIPLYAFILYWAFRYAKKFFWKFLALSIACVGLTDFVSSTVLKPLFGRLRPCHDETLQPILRHIIDCAGKYAMPSGHATNHFGIATFWFFSILWMRGQKWRWLWVWAAAICYAQIYVGKHYPFDILVGTGLGISIGYLMYYLFAKWTVKERSL